LQQQHSDRSAGLTGGSAPPLTAAVSHPSTTSPPSPVSLSPSSLSACHGILQPSNTWRCGHGESGAQLLQCVLTLTALGGRRVMASSNYKCVDTSWSIHNQTWMWTQSILWHAADNGILVDEKYFSSTRENFSRLKEIKSR